jgi:NAD(P)-dependent dehydrogenase (short-subunit alcohol dehydrogenase family)
MSDSANSRHSGDLPGNCVLITGATKGIGLATARLFHEHGFAVAAAGRDLESIRPLEGPRFLPVYMDVTDHDSVATAVEAATAKFGSVAVLVNNAGVGFHGPIDSVATAELREQFEVNVFGVHRVTAAVLPHIPKGGRIINISSAAGRVSLPHMGPYCASKFALEALSDAMRVELRPREIRVVLIEPGPVATAFGENSERDRRLLREKLDLENPDGTAVKARRRSEELQRRWRRNLDFFRCEPEKVATVVFRAATARRPKARYRITLPAWGAELGRLLPSSLFDRLAARATR